MRSFIFTILFFPAVASGQTLIFDQGHFNIVSENGAMRSSAENVHDSYLHTINKRLDDINLNMAMLVAVQDMILGSLQQVDQGLKSAIAVKQIGELAAEIAASSSKVLEIAKSDPVLLLFTENLVQQSKDRAYNLFLEVSNIVLKEGDNVLMDFEKRDALLKKISLELRVIRALVFNMEKSMYWARLKGVFKSLNPYQGFISQDQRLVNDIMSKYHILKP